MATMGAATATFNPQQFVPDADAARQHYVGREMQVHGKMGPTFDPTTSYGADFTAHPLERREAFAPNSQYKGPNAKFDATTSYTNDYTQHPMERRPQQAQQQYSRNTAPFEGSTTHKDAYKAHAIDPSAYRRGDPRAYSPKSVPFEGNTSYKSDYVPHGFEPRQAAPPAEYHGNNAPFDGTTSYNAEYHPHALEPRVSPNVPRGQPRPNAPFDGNTSYKDDYKQWEIERRPPFEGGQYQPSGAKFEGSTEALDAYRAWPIDPSTYQRGQGPPPMRPYVPFDGSTTMKDAFKGWQLPSKRPALGVQMVGDRTYVLIPADAPTPAVGKQVFTTVHDNQSDMCILVLRGDAPVASRNSVLGQFDLRGLPPGPRGSARVEVSFFLDESNVLVAQAADLDAARQEQWLRQGSMMAVNHSSDVRTL